MPYRASLRVDGQDLPIPPGVSDLGRSALKDHDRKCSRRQIELVFDDESGTLVGSRLGPNPSYRISADGEQQELHQGVSCRLHSGDVLTLVNKHNPVGPVTITHHESDEDVGVEEDDLLFPLHDFISVARKRKADEDDERASKLARIGEHLFSSGHEPLGDGVSDDDFLRAALRRASTLIEEPRARKLGRDKRCRNRTSRKTEKFKTAKDGFAVPEEGSLSVGMEVYITENVKEAERLAQGFGGWAKAMAQHCGHKGTVTNLLTNAKIRVTLENHERSFVWNIKSLRIRSSSKCADKLVRDARVARGPDWEWGNQDGGKGHEGKVLGVRKDGWYEVEWDTGMRNLYRHSADKKDIVAIVSSSVASSGPERSLFFSMTWANV